MIIGAPLLPVNSIGASLSIFRLARGENLAYQFAVGIHYPTWWRMKIRFVILAAVVLASLSNLQGAASKDTANYITSKIELFEGTSTKIDIAYLVRINLNVSNADVALFVAKTIDKLNMSFAGDILLIADKSAADTLIKKYGTSMEHFGNNIRYKSLVGKVGRIKHKGKVDIVFINISADENPENLPIERSAATSLGTKPEIPQ